MQPKKPGGAPAIKKETAGNVKLYGVTHQRLGYDEHLNNYLKHGVTFPGLTKDADVVCHETFFVAGRDIQKEEGKRYYNIDISGDNYDKRLNKIDKEFGTRGIARLIYDEEIRSGGNIFGKVFSDDALKKTLEPLRSTYSIDMRNAMMAERIRAVMERHPNDRIAVVVGKGHLEGITRMLGDDEERKNVLAAAKEEYPEKFGRAGEISESEENPETETEEFVNDLFNHKTLLKKRIGDDIAPAEVGRIGRVGAGFKRMMEGLRRQMPLRVFRNARASQTEANELKASQMEADELKASQMEADELREMHALTDSLIDKLILEKATMKDAIAKDPSIVQDINRLSVHAIGLRANQAILEHARKPARP